MQTYTPKDPTEAIFYGIDFSALLGTGENIAAANSDIRVVSGQDPGSNAMLLGNPVIGGSIVKQLIGGGVAEVVYLFSMSITTSTGQTFVESAQLKVIERD